MCGCRNDRDYITMDEIKNPVSIFDGQKVNGILMSDCYERKKLVKWLEKNQYPIAVVNPDLEEFKEAEKNGQEELGLQIMLKERSWCEPTTFAFSKMPHPDYYISVSSIDFIRNENFKEFWKIPFATLRLYINGKISDAKQLFVLMPKLNKVVKFTPPANDEYAAWLSNPMHPNFPNPAYTVEQGIFGHSKFLPFEKNGRKYLCPSSLADTYREDRLYRFQPLFQCMVRGPGQDCPQISNETVFQMTLAESEYIEISWGWCNTFNFAEKFTHPEYFTQYELSETTNQEITENLFKLFSAQLRPVLNLDPIDEIAGTAEIIAGSMIDASLSSTLPTNFVCLIGLNANMKNSTETITLLREELLPIIQRIYNLSYNPIFCFVWTRGVDPINYPYTKTESSDVGIIEMFKQHFYDKETQLRVRSCNIVRVQNLSSDMTPTELEIAFFDPTNTVFETDPTAADEVDRCFTILVNGMASSLEDQ